MIKEEEDEYEKKKNNLRRNAIRINFTANKRFFD